MRLFSSFLGTFTGRMEHPHRTFDLLDVHRFFFFFFQPIQIQSLNCFVFFQSSSRSCVAIAIDHSSPLEVQCLDLLFVSLKPSPSAFFSPAGQRSGKGVAGSASRACKSQEWVFSWFLKKTKKKPRSDRSVPFTPWKFSGHYSRFRLKGFVNTRIAGVQAPPPPQPSASTSAPLPHKLRPKCLGKVWTRRASSASTKVSSEEVSVCSLGWMSSCGRPAGAPPCCPRCLFQQPETLPTFPPLLTSANLMFLASQFQKYPLHHLLHETILIRQRFLFCFWFVFGVLLSLLAVVKLCLLKNSTRKPASQSQELPADQHRRLQSVQKSFSFLSFVSLFFFFRLHVSFLPHPPSHPTSSLSPPLIWSGNVQ